jgi:molecular chaperone GrpE
VLAKLGFSRRDDMGAMFDPARHEAVASRTVADAAPGTVVEVVQPGYGTGEHQLRPARVVVAVAD